MKGGEGRKRGEQGEGGGERGKGKKNTINSMVNFVPFNYSYHDLGGGEKTGGGEVGEGEGKGMHTFRWATP